MSEEGRNEIIWGIVILAVAGGITLGTYITATPGSTYWIAWGGIIWGLYKVVRGFGNATPFWRGAGIVMVIAMAIGSLLAFQGSRDLSDFYNSLEVGECVDRDGLVSECAGAAYEVLSVSLYPDDMDFPSQARFDTDSEACPAKATETFSPTRETWDDGDRLFVCVSKLGSD